MTGSAIAARLMALWAAYGTAGLEALGLAVVGVLSGAMLRSARRRRRIAAMATTGSWIRVTPPPEVDAAGARAFWAALGELRRRGQPWVVWHFQATGGAGAGVWLWVPQVIPVENVRRAVQGAWPKARTEESKPPPVEAPKLPSRREMAAERARYRRARADGETPEAPKTPPARLVGAELALRSSAVHALDTESAESLHRHLIAQVAHLEAGEAVVVQVLARPAPGKLYGRLLAHAGRAEADAHRLRSHKAPGATRAMAQVRKAWPKLDDALWLTRVRVAVLGNHPGRATGRIDGVLSAFGVVRAPAQHLTRRRCSVVPGDLRHDRGDLLSSGELATLAGLPSASILEASRARVVAAGPEVPAKGMRLGVSVGRPVAIAFPDVLYHAHVIGPTGVGKTTLLTSMALDLLAAGWSLVTADIAKGDLVDWILARLPEPMVGKVCVIDPTAESVPGLNVLATDNPVLTADQLVGTFSRLYSSAWGPHLEQVLRQAFLTLAYGGGTLVELELLLTDESFRSKMVGKVLADAGRRRASYAMAKLEGYWAEFDSKTDRERSRLLDPVLYKLDGFIPASVAAVIGQVSPKGDPLSVVDEGGSVFVRAPAGEVGDDPARLLASLLAIRNWQRLQARSAVPEDERPRLQRVAFLADEAQDMFGSRAKGQGEVAERMLVQARGLGGAFIVGHQHLTQLTPDFAKALGTNATTKVLFRLDEDDAKKFASRVSPEFREQDLMALEFGQAVCKPCINRGQGAAFTFRTEPLPPGDQGRLEAARAASAQRWGRPRAEVEEEMVARHRGHLQVVR